MIKKLLLALAIIFGGFLVAAPAGAFQALNPACQTAPNSAICNQADNQGTTNPIAGPGGVISIAANIIGIVAGVAAVIIIIIAGFSYITSAGNAESATKARQRLVGAAIGLAVVVLGWSIVTLVIDKIIK